MEEVVGSFPYEEWANEVQDALSGKGVMAEVVYAGPRAYPVYIDSRDSKKAQEVLADIGYMNCSTGGGHLGLGNVLGWFPFDGTEEDYEELEGDVSQAMDKMVEKLANASAAQAWSNNEDRDMFVVADFDGQIGVMDRGEHDVNVQSRAVEEKAVAAKANGEIDRVAGLQ